MVRKPSKRGRASDSLQLFEELGGLVLDGFPAVDSPKKSEVSVQVLRGDCLERLKELPDDSIDACVTDPPYGLSKEPDIAEVMRHWLEGDDYLHNSRGFMGKSWDSFVPGPRYWKEVYRVLKPGAHLLCFSGTRTWDLMSMALRFAGFENRDTISHEGPPALRWLYGSGFPKGLAVDKAIDKLSGIAQATNGKQRPENRVAYGKGAGALRCDICGKSRNGTSCHCDLSAPATEAAKRWAGWNVALKPSWEVILVFRKPLEKGQGVARNVLKHGTGAINVDASRISSGQDYKDKCESVIGLDTNRNANTYGEWTGKRGSSWKAEGRWPANLLLSHHEHCEKVGTKRVKAIKGGSSGARPENNVYGKPTNEVKSGVDPGYGDPDGYEEVEAWECAKDEAGNYLCPVALLDEQSGISRSPKTYNRSADGYGATAYGKNIGESAGKESLNFGDKGGASRFFKTFEPDTGPPPSGRWPANLILSHHENCQKVGTKRVKGDYARRDNENRKPYESSSLGRINPAQGSGHGYVGPDGFEEVEAWECAKDEAGNYVCPVALLDEQSGTLKSNSGKAFKRNPDDARNAYGAFNGDDAAGYYGDKGGASRFIKTFEPDTGPGFKYQAKASRAERNKGLEGMPEKNLAGQNKWTDVDYRRGNGEITNKAQSNHHPTVKPIALMRYLVKMITPPGGTVLDCFAGSGSTGVAAVAEGFHFIGIEAEEEYADISEKRIAHWSQLLEETPKKRSTVRPEEPPPESKDTLF